MDNWKISRAGVINFWYYDEAYFPFSDGRLLLRGANGSGKSVTMQSLVPLLFDGNKSPERLDPFGSRARKMESYLLSDGLELEERTGYLFLEFERESTASHLTIGMGMRARKNMPLQSWYFLVLDGRRIGPDYDFNLYKDLAAKIPLTARELENKLGAGGRFFDSQKEYRAAVNEHIFGFSDVGEFEELVELLIQLRSPKLSKEFKPTTMYEIMQNSLQTLSDDDLRPMSDSILSMDEIKTRIEELERSRRSLGKILAVYDKYNALQMALKAQHWLRSHEQVVQNQKTREANAVREVQLSRDLAESQSSLETLRMEEESLREKEKSLQAHDIARLMEEQLRQIDHLAALKNNLKLKEDGLYQLKTQERQLHADLAAKGQELQKIRIGLDRQLSDLDRLGEDLGFEEQGFFREEFRKGVEDTFQFGPHERQLALHEDLLKTGQRLLGELDELQRRQDALFDEVARFRSEKDRQARLVAETEAQFSRIKDEYVEQIFAWYDKLEGIQVQRQAMSAAAELAQRYGEPCYFDDLIAPVRKAVEAALRPIEKGIDEQRLACHTVEVKRNEEQSLLAQLRNNQGLDPPRQDKVVRNRERLQAAGIPFVPLYQALDFKKEVSQQLRGTLEEALLDLGLLDALLVPPQFREQALACDSGMADKYLFSSPELFSYNLSEYLKTDGARSGASPEQVGEFLASMFLDPGQSSGVTKPFIQEDGQYGMGLIRGVTTRSHKPSFLGEEARKRYQEELIQLCQERIESLERELELAGQRMAELEQIRQSAYRALEDFPRTTDLDLAFREREKEFTELSRLEQLVEAKVQEHQALYEQVKEKSLEVHQQLARLHQSPLTKARIEELLETLSEYRAGLSELKLAQKDLLSVKSTLSVLESHYEDTVERIDGLHADYLEMERQERQALLRLEGIRQQMGLTDFRQIQEELQACLTRLSDMPRERDGLIGTVKTLEAELANLKKEEEVLFAQSRRLELWMELSERGLMAELSLGYYQLQSQESDYPVSEAVPPDAKAVPPDAKAIPPDAAEVRLSHRQVEGLLKQTGSILEDRKNMQALADTLQEILLKEGGQLAEYNMKRKDLFSELVDWVAGVSLSEGRGPAGSDLTGSDLTGSDLADVDFLDELETRAASYRRFALMGRYGGRDVSCRELSDLIEAQIKEKGLLLDEKDRELFEEILIKSISRKISARIWHSQKWVERINGLMESMDTSSGMMLHLNWETRKAESEDQLDTRELVSLLKMDQGLLTQEHREKLIRHFRSKIQESRIRAAEQTDFSSFNALMKDILDYRKWFEFQLYYTKKGDRRKEMTNNAFYTFSGGEKAMAMYVPLFSAVYAKYQGARPDCPKVISLDEAFAGVDERNIRDMFRLLIELDLSFVANSQVLYGDYDTVPALSIYELIRPENVTFVTLLRYHWDGKIRTLVEEEIE